MVRRPSFASLDSGTESTVYGEASATEKGRGESADKAPWGGSCGRSAVWPVRVAAGRSRAPYATVGDPSSAGSSGLGGGSGDMTATTNWMLSGWAGLGTPRLATSYDMSVIDRQSARWYVKDIRASTQPMGTQ